MTMDLPIGCAGNGVLHTDREVPDIDTRFRMVAEAGVFDYYDKSPLMGEVDQYLAASARHGVPIRATGWYYVLGRDEPLLEWNLRVAAQVGAVVHNSQIMTRKLDGTPVSDAEVAESYLRAYDIGKALGVDPCFEIHINMWSEHFGRVERVGRLVEARGVPFNMTLDHSHVIFKIDNPAEQAVQDMKADIDAGRLVLDPFQPGHVCGIWIEAGWVRHAHARAAVPNNPINVWAKHPDGSPGRGVQYPFFRPAPGEWHSDWDEARLEPWKEVIRQLMRWHATHPESRLGQISTEFIPPPDYGGGARYSIFEQNVACARWLRETWAATMAAAGKA
ncbi:MAG: hypothetical protein R3D25_00180 [Geminicoccaceae bacterium]